MKSFLVLALASLTALGEQDFAKAPVITLADNYNIDPGFIAGPPSVPPPSYSPENGGEYNYVPELTPGGVNSYNTEYQQPIDDISIAELQAQSFNGYNPGYQDPVDDDTIAPQLTPDGGNNPNSGYQDPNDNFRPSDKLESSNQGYAASDTPEPIYNHQEFEQAYPIQYPIRESFNQQPSPETYTLTVSDDPQGYVQDDANSSDNVQIITENFPQDIYDPQNIGNNLSR